MYRYQVLSLVGGGSLINGATPDSFIVTMRVRLPEKIFVNNIGFVPVRRIGQYSHFDVISDLSSISTKDINVSTKMRDAKLS